VGAKKTKADKVEATLKVIVLDKRTVKVAIGSFRFAIQGIPPLAEGLSTHA
jgi:hypothetical protein